MKKALILAGILISLMIGGIESFAQNDVNRTKDTLAATVANLAKAMNAFEKLKISGFIHAQYQRADTLGAASVNGGDFAAASSQRFMVRRAYLKVEYAGNLTNYVLLFNANEKGFGLLDAYFSVKDPWLKAISLKGGIFYRPFGYELSYSRTLRESPELGRVTQLMFPNERDLGAMLTFQMPEKSPLNLLKIDAGLFTGNGINAETDNKLDFIGRIGIAKGLQKNKVSYGFGISTYNGSVYQAKKETYEMGTSGDIRIFQLRLADSIPGTYFRRRYLGFDEQFSIQTILGKTLLRGEFMTGNQPGSEKSGSSPTTTITNSLFLRKFDGATFFLVQTIPGNKHSIVIKYDFYDPNTQIKGSEIGKKASDFKATNGTDIAYFTWGFGWITDLNKNLRLVAYYDWVKNETSPNLAGFGKDHKDNVFTLRVQFKY